MTDFTMYLYAVACILMVIAALGRRHSGGAAFGFLVLSVVATPVLAYALLMALPLAPEPVAEQPREKLFGD